MLSPFTAGRIGGAIGAALGLGSLVVLLREGAAELLADHSCAAVGTGLGLIAAVYFLGAIAGHLMDRRPAVGVWLFAPLAGPLSLVFASVGLVLGSFIQYSAQGEFASMSVDAVVAAYVLKPMFVLTFYGALPAAIAGFIGGVVSWALVRSARTARRTTPGRSPPPPSPPRHPAAGHPTARS